MLLETGERDILGSLEVGAAVVKLQGRCPRPFLISIREFEINKGMFTDNMVRERMKGIVNKYVAVHNMPTSTGSGSVSIHPCDHGQSLDPRALAFLVDVRDYPESGVAARYKRIGLSVRQGQKLKANLVEQDLVQEQETRTPIGRLRVIRLTEQGQLLLSEHQHDTDKANPGQNT